MMILDCYHCVYIWEGNEVSREEKRDTLSCALGKSFKYIYCIRWTQVVTFIIEYVKKHPDGRSSNKEIEDKVYLIQAGKEPLSFVNCFFGWDWGTKRKDKDSTIVEIAKDVLREYT